MLRRTAHAIALAIALATMTALTSCGNTDGAAPGGADTGNGTGAASAPSVSVVASFYPLAHAVERVGGDRVDLTNLTQAGQDPHHLELTPQQVAAVDEAALVVYAKGTQPAADTAIEAAQPNRALDVSSLANLPAESTQAVGGGASTGDHGHSHEHGGSHADGDGHDHGPNDPHFWLDPQRYSSAVTMIAGELAAMDPAGEQTYTANAAAFRQELSDLDSGFAEGLATCEHRDLVTGHTALAYLADRYEFNQVGLAGVLNDGEPDPARLAGVTEYVQQNGVTTVYAGEGQAQGSAETVAREAGVELATLDTIELSRDGGYIARMEANLPTLRAGQGCR